jgi:hypothetical protein
MYTLFFFILCLVIEKGFLFACESKGGLIMLQSKNH